jgi:hypothetical protein
MKYKDWNDWRVQQLTVTDCPFEKRTYVTHKSTDLTAWAPGHHNLSAESARDAIERELEHQYKEGNNAKTN